MSAAETTGLTAKAFLCPPSFVRSSSNASSPATPKPPSNPPPAPSSSWVSMSQGASASNACSSFSRPSKSLLVAELAERLNLSSSSSFSKLQPRNLKGANVGQISRSSISSGHGMSSGRANSFSEFISSSSLIGTNSTLAVESRSISPVSSLICRVERNWPPPPPESNCCVTFLNRGSISNSSSNFDRLIFAKFFSTVALFFFRLMRFLAPS